MSRLIKNVLKKLVLAGGIFLAARYASATDIAYSGVFVGTEGSATSAGQTQAANYTRNFNTTGDRVTLQVVASTYTLAVSTSFHIGELHAEHTDHHDHVQQIHDRLARSLFDGNVCHFD